jgi:hypothetical protein
MIPSLALFAIRKGPRVPSSVTAKDLLAKALDWERRTGSAQKEGFGSEEAWDPEATFDDDVQDVPPDAAEEANAPLQSDEIRDRVTSAAVELSQLWQEEVMAGVPSRFILDLCGVADRGAYLLDEVAPELAKAFVPVRDVFMRHSQDGDRRSREELEGAVDELEALLDAVIQRALELHAG